MAEQGHDVTCKVCKTKYQTVNSNRTNGTTMYCCECGSGVSEFEVENAPDCPECQKEFEFYCRDHQ